MVSITMTTVLALTGAAAVASYLFNRAAKRVAQRSIDALKG